ncbi:Sel1 domain-containing protein repeat-containing protein [Pseudomonas sp. Os17]|uniref:sel1 repeat family protein n=1 Tax=Pseudomonas sp. Os17 TaxID=1500686 RepID=UPI0005FC4705|nr:sel1 repeat family protein [Pseudomonas sp. Os17]BAQ74222.1 Sel1 domain-containing protein repeat-containing protein [Pseudomonas sp. Os17]
MHRFYRFCLLGAVWLSTFAASAAPVDPALVEGISAKVQARQDWQAQARQCPSDNMPARTATRATQANRCETPEQLGACLQRCEAGDGNDCYWLATTLQQAKGPAAGYEPLYQRACSLGLVSGCTNRAAGMLTADADNQATRHCAVQTFNKACELNDPWACTMYGFHLSRGIGVAPDADLALKVLDKSCKYGPADPACSGARQLQEEIREAIRAARP